MTCVLQHNNNNLGKSSRIYLSFYSYRYNVKIAIINYKIHTQSYVI